MSQDDSQYARSKVQPKDFMSGWVIGFIIAGTALALPVFYLGSQVMMNLGFKQGLVAIGLSTLALTALCIATSLIGSRSRFTTYMIRHFSFGEYGVKIINVIFGLTLIGWYSVGLELLATAIQDTSQESFNLFINKWVIILVTGGGNYDHYDLRDQGIGAFGKLGYPSFVIVSLLCALRDLSRNILFRIVRNGSY